MIQKSKVTFKIKNNEDWNSMKNDELLVDISNDAYFGFRAMEKESQAILYDPNLIDSLVRVAKESRKFPKTIHNLIMTKDTLGFDSSNSEETFLKSASRCIEEVVELNPEILLDFTIDCSNLNEEFIYETLIKIYKK